MPNSSSKPDLERLHKRIAACSQLSRRAAEKAIADGRVTVNGEPVIEMGIQVGPDDEITLDGELLQSNRVFTLVMNKPAGYVTTLSDPQGRPTVKKLLPNLGVALKPVGRLDLDTEGLLVFTNDGLLAHRLAHPSFGVEKEYEAFVHGSPPEAAVEHLRKGVWVDGSKTAPAQVRVLGSDHGRTKLRITIHEGRKRQVRLMCEAVGFPVLSLRRVRFGNLVIKGMPPGSCRMLGKVELDELRGLVGLK